jgi:hypothetical protein
MRSWVLERKSPLNRSLIYEPYGLKEEEIRIVEGGNEFMMAKGLEAINLKSDESHVAQLAK